jgi:AraC-like DNA-binding protein
MRYFDFKPITHPAIYFDELIKTGLSTISYNEHNEVYKCINAANAYWNGVIEFISFKDDCFAINYDIAFHEETHYSLQFHFDKNWYVVSLIIEDNRCFIVSEMYYRSIANITPKSKYDFKLEQDVNHIWYQPVTKSNIQKIVYLFNEDFVKEIFKNLFNVTDWSNFVNNILNRAVCELDAESTIFSKVNGIINSLKEQNQNAISQRKEVLTKLSYEVFDIITGEKCLHDNKKQAHELKMIQLAAKELIKSFSIEPPSLHELSRMTGMNRQKFQNIFKQYYGKSFYQYYQDARFEYAKKLIEQKGYNSSEAAYAIGFKNNSHFARTFAKYFGNKPSNLSKI